MTLFALARQSLLHYRRTHGAVALGIATAVAVMAGALLVGSSVRASLASITASRLGETHVVIGSQTLFTEQLAERLSQAIALIRAPRQARTSPPPAASIAPVLMLEGVVQHEASKRRAGKVQVYGVDERFFRFHRVNAPVLDGPDVLLSPDLARELGAVADDSVLVRVARPTDIPLDSLHARRDEVGRALRLRAGGVLDAAGMGEFSLAAEQGPVRAVFMSLPRLQGDLDQAGRVNTLLLAPLGPEPFSNREVRSALSGSLLPGDLALSIAPHAESSTVIVESDSGLIPEPLAQSIRSIARRDSLAFTPVLSWLATSMTTNRRTVPYSLITGLAPGAIVDPALAPIDAEGDSGPPPIVLNEWAMRDLGASAGDSLQVEYFRWTDEGQLVTDRADFRVAGAIPMRGIGIDRRLVPDYPGITDSNNLADWDPPFPINLRLVRPVDETYWDQYRTTPKAFISLATAQRLWRTRHGQISSMRVARAGNPAATLQDLEALAAQLRTEIPRSIDPLRAGLTLIDVRSQNLAAAVGATDFGAYFSYFSFFLLVSAVILAALFFRLTVEQRVQEIGVLRAFGLTLARVRRLFLLEGTVVCLIGALGGIVLATAWAGLMVYGLRTWWVGAVGTNRLELHVDALSLIAGASMGAAAGLLGMALTIRGLKRTSPRALLTGVVDTPRPSNTGRAGLSPTSIAAFILAFALSAASLAGVIPATAGFFGAGTLALIGGLTAFRAWLKRRPPSALSGQGTSAITRLGIRNASWRPGRSLTSAALVAAAVFLLVSVDSFRKGSASSAGPASGTGGFALIGESALPILHDPASRDGQELFGIGAAADADLAGVTVILARLREGDDASCLNLYQPKQPRVLGVSRRFADLDRFSFAATIAADEQAEQNPWRLLGPADGQGIVPAIIDATSLQYVLHASVGDVLTIDAETDRPVRLRVVASLSDSMLQGEVIVSEEAFLQLYPDVAGYRMALVEVPDATPDRLDAVTRALEDRLSNLGLDIQDSAARLDAYHRVENTYLSTFQTLGGLGLVLGVLGLSAIIARNVLERRRELALLGAAGFTGRELQTLVVAEHLGLVAAGLLIGLLAALVAIAPVLASRGNAPPLLPLVWLALVAIAGWLVSLAATRQVRRLPLVASLRSE